MAFILRIPRKNLICLGVCMACFILFELFLLMMGLCRFQRPPGPIPSSMLGLEALTGSLEDFGFEDYLNGNDIYSFASNLNFGATC